MSWTIGSLFSGIGGLELGLERAGMGPVLWQCEIDPFRREVLAKHWPNAERFEDINLLSHHELAGVDVICGGFPCQDVSSASHARAQGMGGSRSGLWSEFERVVSDIKPRWVIVENIYNQWRRWLPIVRRDLWCLNYASVPIRVCASDVGANHKRPRVFVVAHTNTEGQPLRALHAEVARLCSDARRFGSDGWYAVPGPARMAHGLPNGMDRVRALGDAVVPKVAEVIGEAIMAVESS